MRQFLVLLVVLALIYGALIMFILYPPIPTYTIRWKNL